MEQFTMRERRGHCYLIASRETRTPAARSWNIPLNSRAGTVRDRLVKRGQGEKEIEGNREKERERKKDPGS